VIETVDVGLTAVYNLSYCSSHHPSCQRMQGRAEITSHHQEEHWAQRFDSACTTHLQKFAFFFTWSIVFLTIEAEQSEGLFANQYCLLISTSTY
jgi:hypothetical protein